MNIDFTKLLSGRFICTMAVIAVYVILSLKGILPTDKIMEVTMVILYAYFMKQRPTGNGNGNNENGNSTITTTTIK